MKRSGEELSGPRKIAGDEGLSHELAVGGNGDEILEAIGEAGEDLADVLDGGRGLEGSLAAAVVDPSLPETVCLQIEEWIFRSVFVVVFADEEETGSEAVAELLAPGNMFGSREAFVDQVENCEEQERFVGSLMALAPYADDPDVEVVETFDGGVEKHGIRKAGFLLDGEGKAWGTEEPQRREGRRGGAKPGRWGGGGNNFGFWILDGKRETEV